MDARKQLFAVQCLSIVVGFINEYQSIFSIPFYFNQFVIYVD